MIRRCLNYLTNLSNTIYEAVWETRHPTFYILQWVLVVLGSYTFIQYEFIRLNLLPFSLFHQLLTLVIITIFYYLLIVLRFGDPGIVSTDNFNLIQNRYEIDGLIYYEKFCSTCKWNRPARTRHCKLCNRCHLLMDHHCIWIDNCVANNNHRYFLFYLAIIIIMSGYGNFLYYSLLKIDFIQLKNSSTKYMDVSTGKMKSIEPWIMVVMTLQNNIQLTALHLGLSFVGLFLSLFLISHLMSTVKGMTEVETNKWNYIQSLVKKGKVKYVDPNDPNHQTINNPIEEDDENEDYLIIYHPDQLEFLYDKGSYYDNFMHLVFPPPLTHPIIPEDPLKKD